MSVIVSVVVSSVVVLGSSVWVIFFFFVVMLLCLLVLTERVPGFTVSIVACVVDVCFKGLVQCLRCVGVR